MKEKSSCFLTKERKEAIIKKIKKGTPLHTTTYLLSAQNIALSSTATTYKNLPEYKNHTSELMEHKKVKRVHFNRIHYFIFVSHKDSSQNHDFQGAIIFKKMPKVLIISSPTPSEIIDCYLNKKRE